MMNHSTAPHEHNTPGKNPHARNSIFSQSFTLVELLVALALGVIILAVAVTAFQQTGGVAQLSGAKTEAIQNARVALQMIERDLESAYIEPTGDTFVAEDDPDNPDNWTWNEIDYEADTLKLRSLAGQGGIETTRSIQYKLLLNTNVNTAQNAALPYLVRGFMLDATRNDDTSFSVDGDYESEFQNAADDGDKVWIDLDNSHEVVSAVVTDSEYSSNETTVTIDSSVMTDNGRVWISDWGGSAGEGIRSFNVRYYYDDGNSATDDWYDNWDSTTDSTGDENGDGTDDGPIQYRRLPETVEVTVEAIDADGRLAEENDPVKIRRLIRVK